ncbi:MAG: hypothetical protein QHJ74_05140, partial [Anaerolineae bacterium]|nr:hypothetical protein [Anaerolineae bacterium]
MWDEHLVPPPRGRAHRNPRRNRERWARRLARLERQRPKVTRRERRRRREQLMRALLNSAPTGQAGSLLREPSLLPPPPQPAVPRRSAQAIPSTSATETPLDPLADLRKMRGWIDQM